VTNPLRWTRTAVISTPLGAGTLRKRLKAVLASPPPAAGTQAGVRGGSIDDHTFRMEYRGPRRLEVEVTGELQDRGGRREVHLTVRGPSRWLLGTSAVTAIALFMAWRGEVDPARAVGSAAFLSALLAFLDLWLGPRAVVGAVTRWLARALTRDEAGEA
jgi:hypothetical protein